MKIPSKVNVLSSIYKIKIEPGEFINGNGTVCRGSINFHKRLIQIAKDEDENNMLKTFYHEVSHAICSELQLYDGEQDEDFIERFAVGLTDTLLRNKFTK